MEGREVLLRVLSLAGRLLAAVELEEAAGPSPESPMETTRRRSRTKAKGAPAA